MPAIVAMTQAQILTLFERIFPVEYWQPIADQVGAGLELYQAIAKVFSVASEQVEAMWKGSLITLAPGGSFASATVEFFRDNSTAGAVTILAGSIVTTSNGNRRFLLQTDVVFGALDLGPFSATVIAEYPDEDYNVPGPVTTAAGETIPGEIDTLYRPLLDPILGDLSLQVRQVSDATGGSLPWLEQLGADRGMPRGDGEPLEVYRWRIQQLPQVVTPDAIQAFIAGLFSDPAYPASSIEPNSMLYQTCYDGPPDSDGGEYDPTLFVYDDPRDPLPFVNRWLSEEDAQGAFIVIVPVLPPVQEIGMAYDDPSVDSSDLTNSFGQRAVSVYDLPPGLLPPDGVQEGAFDGTDVGRDAIYQGLLAQLQSIKAGGVFVALELEGN